jgi:ketosteroid isomerase-like protein
MVMTTQHTADEAGIRQQLDKLVEAIHARDLEGVKALYSPDVVSFDVGPALQTLGVEAKSRNWVEAFTLLQGPIGYEIRGLTITVDGDLAFGHAFARLSSGSWTAPWVRATFCLRKIDGSWLIAHDHVSVPLDVRSGKGLVDLEP